MKTLCVFALLLLNLSICPAQQGKHKVVDIISGNLRLKAFLWKPAGSGPFPAVLFNHGSGGTDAAHTAGMPIAEAAEKLAPVFVRHGYVFLYPFRRGQGLSADQGPFMQDVLQKEEVSKGKEARQHLQDTELVANHLDDVMAALSFLKSVPEVDPHRIVLAGHSFGGQLALFATQRDGTVQAVVTFAAAAGSWERSAELRERLLTAVRETRAAIMLIQAQNDYSTAPGRALAEELEHLHRSHVLKILPAVGRTPEDGHNAVYEALDQWEGDVFKFLDDHLSR
jgi:carboxymethylenebutenolidase